MSEMRQTQILEEELVQGYTAKLITAAGAEVKAVKASPGKVVRIRVETNGIKDVYKRQIRRFCP